MKPVSELVGHIKERKNFGVEMDCICGFSNVSLTFWPDLAKLVRMLVVSIKSRVMATNCMPSKPFSCEFGVLTPVASCSREDSIVLIVFSEPCPQAWRIHFVLIVGLCPYPLSLPSSMM